MNCKSYRIMLMTSVVFVMVLLAGCGGASSAVADPPVSTTRDGSVYPATAGLTFAEFGASGEELQRSSVSDANGGFSFAAPLSGERVQVVPDGRRLRAPIGLSARLGADRMSLEVTAVTTLYDQLLLHGATRSEAAAEVASRMSAACGAAALNGLDSALFGDTVYAGDQRPAVLLAARAFNDALQLIGLGPTRTDTLWLDAGKQHATLFAGMCTVAQGVFSPSWLSTTQVKMGQELKLLSDANLDSVDANRKSVTREVLRVMGSEAAVMQYPELTALLGPRIDQWKGQELNIATTLAVARFSDRRTATARGTASAAIAMLDSAGQVMQTLSSTVYNDGTTAPSTLRLSNGAAADRAIELSVNALRLNDIAGVVSEVIALPPLEADEPLYRRAWRYVVEMRRHADPITGGGFQHQADLYLRSVGSGYCDDVSAVLDRIWTAMGYTARVMALSGHVVPEVQVNGRWELYDPDFAVYYFMRDGSVAGVDDIGQDGTLLTNPTTPILRLDSTAYSEILADMYTSLADNAQSFFVAGPDVAPIGSQLTVPANGYLDIDPGAAVTSTTVTEGSLGTFVPLRLWLPPGYVGNVKLPFVVTRLSGDATVEFMGTSIETTAGQADAWLQNFYNNTVPYVGIGSLQVNRVGPGGLVLTMLLNPAIFDSRPRISVQAMGDDLSGLTASTRATAVN